MAKVYSLPTELKALIPQPDYRNYDFKAEEKREEEFVERVKNCPCCS